MPIVLKAKLVRKITPTIGKNIFCKLINNNAINETLKNSIMGKLEGIQYTETMSVSPKKFRKQSVNSKRGSLVDPMVLW